MEQATFGGGCFWCIEAALQQVDGITRVVSGYAGGTVKKPTYDQVCSGTTGHAEVVQVTYDPSKVSFADILQMFWRLHDPTTFNRQGNDYGPQYRSIILYHNQNQREIAQKSIDAATEAGLFSNPILTELVPFEIFYPAEAKHQGYYQKNPNNTYCRAVVGPKVAKFKQLFREKLKETDPTAARPHGNKHTCAVQ